MGLPTTLPGPVAQPPSETAEIYTQKPLANFTTRNVQPPNEVYVTINNTLFVTVWNSVPNQTVSIVYRLLRADGTITAGEVDTPVSADRTANGISIALAEGFLLSVEVFCSQNATARGNTWVMARIWYGVPNPQYPVQTLFTDYLTLNQRLGWPGGRQISSVEGPGWLRQAPVPTTKNNLEVSWTVPTNARWQIFSLFLALSTDATAGVRQVSLSIITGVTTVFKSNASGTQAPSTVINYLVANYGVSPAGASADLYMPVPWPIPVSAGDLITVQQSNPGAGDSYLTNGLLVEEWIEPTS